MQDLPDDFVDNTDPPTVPSTMQEEEEKKVDEAENTPDVEKAVVTPYDAIQASDNNYDAEPRKKSCWSDERGNLKVVNLVVRNPCKIFWLIIALVVALTFVLNIAVFRTAENGNPFTLPGNEFDLMDVRSIQYDSMRLASDKVRGDRVDMGMEGKTTLKQSEVEAIQYWVFEASTPSGLFGDEQSIEGMKDAYDIFLNDPGYEDYCLYNYPRNLSLVTENTTVECTAPLTPLLMYYASYWDPEAVAEVIEELKDPAKIEALNKIGVCANPQVFCPPEIVETFTPEEVFFAFSFGLKVQNITSTWDMKGDLIDNITQATELASYMVLVDVFAGVVDFGFDQTFSVANPASQYSRGILFWGGPYTNRNTSGLSEEEAKEVRKADDDQLKNYILENYLEKMDKQSDPETHATLNSYYFMTAIIGDVILDIVTQDGLLALFSFAFVFCWIRLNTGSWFLAFVGFFEIFFSIPVAWFLFTVVFQIKYFSTLNTLALFIVAAIGADDIFIFMDAYKQSQYHLDILTDLETRMSWVYRRTGTAMAITSATTCAAFLCTLITPLSSIQSFGIFAACVILIDYVLVMSLFCTAVVIYHDRYESRAKCGCCCPCGVQTPSVTENAKAAIEANNGEEMKRDRVSEFFRTKVSSFVQKPLNRLVLAVVFLSWVGVSIWQATKIEPTKENEQFLDENHPLQKSISILDKEFPTANDDIGMKVYYAWGLGLVDRTGVNRLLEPDNFGVPTFESNFDFNDQCQVELLSFSDRLKTDPKYRGLIKRKNGVGQVYSFIEELAAFNVYGNLNNCTEVKKGDWRNAAWQVDTADLPEMMPKFLEQKTCFADDGETVASRYSKEVGWDGATLRYAAISAESDKLDPFGRDSEFLTRQEYDQFILLAEEADELVSVHCSGSVVMTDLDEKFVFMNNQSIYVQTAIQSAILGVCIAFVVLLVSTRVFHIALFASLSITCVLISVVGTMVMMGWYLGSIESILIGIIAGFSVDYVVHLAYAYEIASGDTYERITEAFGDLGISVFNGMITSVVASIPLFFCQLQFFAKFGTFLCLTIAFSWIFANFGFMSLLAQLKIPLKEKGRGCRL
uniref:SSD domain-containing protein n=1 Tax=Skeletonema marinoi TaxID=267567 RepID=A0A7S2PQQ5_9STRA|mmetsp:Transcript_28467/g.48369  ORF Transcript_28467/g.48369 Transcript_28467/m.48369 type:complete len:1085 (+) Transcript_28467:157-3411(+)